MSRFNAIFMDHFQSPRNAGRIDSPTHSAKAGSLGSGSYFELELLIENDIVRRSGFKTFGCGAVIASGSMMTTLIQDRSLTECLAMDVDAISAALGGLPDDKRWCAQLAIDALRNALASNALPAR